MSVHDEVPTWHTAGVYMAWLTVLCVLRVNSPTAFFCVVYIVSYECPSIMEQKKAKILSCSDSTPPCKYLFSLHLMTYAERQMFLKGIVVSDSFYQPELLRI